ncbi:hypothetical protein [Panacagrimonas perspica]|nr:hypothetical protein [Panacagrimonas perspica]
MDLILLDSGTCVLAPLRADDFNGAEFGRGWCWQSNRHLLFPPDQF